ncbi:MAG: 30S ribosomal protein S4 [Rickettsiales bacterium]|jgi:small subunit ribosomal protein S4|nr:30S ribosomal protein S4 [Rickettsiales bacterium]
MSQRSKAKQKIARRYGVNLWAKPKSPVNKRKYKPGQHGPTARVKQTEYGRQLAAKQILRGYYGNIGEKKFRFYYEEAMRRRGDTSEELIAQLESRLDAVVYRAGFVPSVFAARQMVSHGHVLLNGRRVNIGSCQVKPGDTIGLADKVHNLPVVVQAQNNKIGEMPDYLSAGSRKFEVVFVRVPALAEVPYPVKMEPGLVVEFYSR